MAATTTPPLTTTEQQVLEYILAEDGMESTGAIEHKLSLGGRGSRAELRKAWLSLIDRGLLVIDSETSRSSKANPVYWVQLVDMESIRYRLESLELGPRLRISSLAERLARAAA